MDKLKAKVAHATEKIKEIDIPVRKTVDKVARSTEKKIKAIDIPVRDTVDGITSKIKSLVTRDEDNNHPTLQPAATAMMTANGRIEIEILDADAIELPPRPELNRSTATYFSPHFSRSDAVVGNSVDDARSVPPMHICIMIVGTRGDVQPFIGIGKRLMADGHRVRLATHAIYRSMVTDGGLEFYPLGGDPKELAAYMVKTGGHLIPLGYEVITKDMPRNIQMVEEILFSTWPAVHAADPGAEHPLPPFRANAIISNPVTYGHIHVAEKLGVPLHIMFPQPWVPTEAFPHPLSNLAYKGKKEKKNYHSYKLVDLLMWKGTEAMVNTFREEVLGLQKIRTGDAGRNVLLDLRIPHSFMWSPHLVPSPDDWDPALYDVIGTVCDSGIPAHTPSPEFAAFLAAGPPPIFVGFGSMVIPDTAKTTRTIVDAALTAHARVVLQSSWSDMTAGGTITIPDNVFLLGNCPHDWLFPRMAAVVHHGGAGTTAAGLLAGKPTFIVPFFGDQPFWGWAVVNAGVGVPPCPIADLTTPVLTRAFEGLLSPDLVARAVALQAAMQAEDGVEAAAQSFYRHLPLDKMQCALTPEHVATKWLAKDQLPVCDCCAFVVRSATDQAVLDYHAIEYTRSGPRSGLEGAAHGAGAFVHELGSSLVGVVAEPTKGYKKDGAKGAALGAAKGIANLALMPFNGIALFADRVAVGNYNLRHHGEKHKQPRFEPANLFKKQDVSFTTGDDDDAARSATERLHRKSLAPLVGISVSPEQQSQILADLHALIARKEHRELLPGDDKGEVEAPATVVTVVDDSDDDDPTPSVPLTVRSLRWSKAGGFHMDYDVHGDLLHRAPSMRHLDTASSVEAPPPPPFAMNVCMLAIGSRPEVEAAVAVARELATDGHRVRVAVNPRYQALVVAQGLEFFALQGNPTTVADWMGQLSPAGVSTSDGPWCHQLAFLQSTWEAVKDGSFRADLILSHPGVIVHRHLAERLGVPVQLLASSPWTPTSEFPHPLMEASPAWSEWSNWLSYAAVEEYGWSRLKDVLNQFRTETLGLPAWHQRLPPSVAVWKIPVTYLWSPTLLAKAHDWGREIAVVGFPELAPAAEYTPPETLRTYLTAAVPTLYVNLKGLDLRELMNLLHEAFAASPEAFHIVAHDTNDDGVRDLLISDGDRLCVAPQSVPVDWLVPRCDGVLHQATEDVVRALLKFPRPALACPATGTQRLWASRLLQLAEGAALPPIPLGDIRTDPKAVAAAFASLLTLDIKRRNSVVTPPATTVLEEIREAPRRAVDAIYKNVPVPAMACDVVPTKPARVYIPQWDLKLCHEAAFVGRHVWGDDVETRVYKPVFYSLSDGPQYVSMEKRNTMDSAAHRNVVAAFATMLSAAAPESGLVGRFLARAESMPGIAVDVSGFWASPQEEAASRARIMRSYEEQVDGKQRLSGSFGLRSRAGSALQ
ncbi:sterol 3-beta-glucosyltransferase [Achlya hypogyna]|uniref:Sterol 3-beta-glucosyltransferase n=1 Tax=Achlya hypogyna TaxID=1202772 RepID=A0A1V9ZSW3_ACHHY|nr:sterol 3-beta-glucosyltransferase [Achlya hypogyna]